MAAPAARAARVLHTRMRFGHRTNNFPAALRHSKRFDALVRCSERRRHLLLGQQLFWPSRAKHDLVTILLCHQRERAGHVILLCSSSSSCRGRAINIRRQEFCDGLWAHLLRC